MNSFRAVFGSRCLLVSLAFAVAACAGPETESRALVTHGDARADLAPGASTEARPDPARLLVDEAEGFAVEGQDGLALESLQSALELRPEFELAHRRMAEALCRLDREEESIAHFRAALDAAPSDPALHNDLGAALQSLERFDEASDAFNASLDLAPEFSPAWVSIANLEVELGHDRVAAERYETALSLAPDAPETHVRFARFLATTADEELRDGERAVALAERAAELASERTLAMVEALSWAYSAVGRFDDAAKSCEEAIVLALDEGDIELAWELDRRLAHYAAGRPYQARRAD